ncbi:MAG TPA: phospholipase D-like domain-containing protein [Tepidisphaeraceae bacterium]|nr:phospholipase D-like domain-containing protein [Tepidisphaeraceae bacterium]
MDSHIRRSQWTTPEPVELADGSRLHIYKDGAALAAALEAIHRARRLIGLEVYIFRGDQTGQAFANALCDRARRGVRVFVIYDSFGSFDTDPQIFERMRSAGVRVIEFHPMWPWNCHHAWRPANRNHRKLLIVDDTIAGMGGLNIGDEYAGSGATLRWRDSAMAVVGPSSRPLLHAFARTWHYCRHGGRIRQAQYVYQTDPRQETMGVMASVPTTNSRLRPWLCGLLRKAQWSIELTMAYFAPDDDLIRELCRAGQRGVRIRLLVPGRTDHPLLQAAGRSFYETLMNAGAEIYEWRGEMMHAKTLIVDRQITVMGSANLDHRSIEYNLEISAIIHSRAFGQQMTRLFEFDTQQARTISLETWRYRPFTDRIVQWAVSRARYWM